MSEKESKVIWLTCPDCGSKIGIILSVGKATAIAHHVESETVEETENWPPSSFEEKLKAAGVDTLIEQSAAKAAAQSIRKVHELNWNPLHIIGASSASVETVLKPAGLEASKGLVTTQFLKQPGDPAWANDEEVHIVVEVLRFGRLISRNGL